VQGVAGDEVVLGGGLVVGHLLAAVDEALLDGGDTLLLLDLFLDLRDLVVHLDIELNLLAGQRSNLDQHDGLYLGVGARAVRWADAALRILSSSSSSLAAAASLCLGGLGVAGEA
jgi:5-keto 4-deoxyuronate isomerase